MLNNRPKGQPVIGEPKELIRNRLDGLRVYLSGSMEKSNDLGCGWRQELTPILEFLGMSVLDPTNKQNKLSFCSSASEEHSKLIQLRHYKNYDELTKCSKEVVRCDLSYVDRCDIMIVRMDTDYFSVGTIDEFVTACLERKPILMWCVQGKQNMPIWLFGRMNHKYMFDSDTELMEFIYKLAFNDNIDDLVNNKFTTMIYPLTKTKTKEEVCCVNSCYQ